MIFKGAIPFLIIAGIILTSFQCDRIEDCEGYEAATLVNLTGLDGCSWVIQLKADGTRLEPTNLEDFVASPVTNQSICVKYEIRNNLGSICMVGPSVDIIELKLP